ncbi:MAG: glycosyltransferase family 39 protein, partial [Dehalococcoidia bacterium]
AAHLLEHPLDFYGFNVHWHVTWQPMHEINMNPPGLGYFLALAGAIFGWNELALHTVFLIPAIAAATGTAFLARQWNIPPLPAVFATVATPAFVVSGTTLMSDMLFLAVYVWAIALWVRGDDTGRMRWLIAAAVLASIGVLVKYLAITALPLMAMHTIVSSRKLPRLPWLLIPVAVLLAYHFLTLRLYGHSLVFGATGFATGHGGASLSDSAMKTLVALAFLGGCFIGVACFAPLTMRPRHILLWLAVFLGVALLLFLIGRLDFRLIRLETGVRWSLLLQAALMITAGLYLLWLPATQLARRRDAPNLILACWLIGTFVFCAFINWTINARVLLAAAPAAGLLAARALAEAHQLRRVCQTRLAPANQSPLQTGPAQLAIQTSSTENKTTNQPNPQPLSINNNRCNRCYLSTRCALALLAALLALIPAWLDYRLAQAHRDAAHYIATQLKLDRATTRFQGHWGFQHYMMQAGYNPYDSQEGLKPGHQIVTMHNSPSVVPLPQELTTPT